MSEALASVRTIMPGGTTHCRMDYVDGHAASAALGEYLEAIARGVPQAEAVSAYETARKAAS